MGRDKLQLPLGDRCVLGRVVDAVHEAGPGDLWIVTRPGTSRRVRESIGEETGARILENPRADEGMGTSIAHAAARAPRDVEGLLLVQGDQPLLSGPAIRSIVDRFRRAAPPFVAARYGDLVTTPVFFHGDLLGELSHLEGDRGARSVLERHAAEGELHDLPQEMGLDVDDPNDYRRVETLWRHRAR